MTGKGAGLVSGNSLILTLGPHRRRCCEKSSKRSSTGLDKHLALVTDSDPDRVRAWRLRLGTVALEAPCSDLRTLAAHMINVVEESPRRSAWRKLDRKARKVLAGVDRALHPWPVDDPRFSVRGVMTPDEIGGRVRDLQARLIVIQTELHRLDRDLCFADTVQDAAAVDLDVLVTRGATAPDWRSSGVELEVEAYEARRQLALDLRAGNNRRKNYLATALILECLALCALSAGTVLILL